MIERISAYHKKFFGGFEELSFCYSGTYEYLFCGNDIVFERGAFGVSKCALQTRAEASPSIRGCVDKLKRGATNNANGNCKSFHLPSR